MSPHLVVILVIAADTLLTYFISPRCDNFITPKETSLCLSAIFVLFSGAYLYLIKRRGNIPRPGVPGVLFIACFFFMALSCLASPNLPYSIYELKLPLAYVLLYVCLLYAFRKTIGQAGNYALVAVVLTGALYALHGLAQYYGFDFLGIQSRYIQSSSRALHVYSMFGNPNLLAGHLAIVFPCALYGFLSNNGKGTKAFYTISTVIIAGGLFAAGSRAGALAASFGVMYLAAHYIIVNRQAMKAAISILLAVFYIGWAFYFYYGADIPGKEGSSQLRIFYWKSAVSLFSEKKFGSGPGTFRLRHFDFQSSYLEQHGTDKLKKLVTFEKPRYPHNEFLNMLVDSGIIAATLFLLVFVFGILKSLPRGTPENNNHDSTPWGAMLSAFSVIALFGFPLYVPVTGFLLPLSLAGIDISCGDNKKYDGPVATGSRLQFSSAVIFVLVIVIGILWADKNVDILRSRIYLSEAKRQMIAAKNSADTDINQLFNSSLKSAARASELNPLSSQTYNLIGSVYMMTGDPARALENFLQAKKTTRDINLEINIGLAQWDIGEKEDAVESMKRASRISPLDARPLKILANFYLHTFEYRKSLDMMYKAHEIEPDDPELNEMINKLEAFIKKREEEQG